MKHYLLLFLLTSFGVSLAAQQVKDYTVQVSATADAVTPAIHFSWPLDSNTNVINILRKQKNATLWGSFPIAVVGPGINTFSDTNVVVGDVYEYRFAKSTGGYNGEGYILAGIEAAAIEDRGKLILVIDTLYRNDLAFEIERLEKDLIGDGWIIKKIEVDRTDDVSDIRTLIRNEYLWDPNGYEAVFLLGHVPVPYSGNIAPDGHSNHVGAWPTDAYYGEMTGNWTDFSVSNTSASRAENRNVPGDGKFDQSTIPTTVELQVGRVDFANMSSFSEGEKELLKRYLDKDHAWRHKEFTVIDRAVIDDNFGVFSGEIFAGSGWRNFAPMVGAANVSSGDYFTSLTSGDYLLAYGCGGGSYTSLNGIGNTTDFVNDSIQGVFNLLFGSYNGDWDANNNFLRASLASRGTMLGVAWSGRPHWQMHQMALGETFGYCARSTQNNSNTYFFNIFARLVHIALIGDPTLRLHVVAPISNLNVNPVNAMHDIQLDWNRSADTVLGYYVYRSNDSAGPYTRLTTQIIPDSFWTDNCPEPGMNYYMVKAVNLHDGFSGSYYNLSQGIFGNANTPGSLALNALPVGSYCAGDAIAVGYMVNGPTCPTTIFVAELSDASGSFAAPDTIGTLQDTGSGTINGFIPNQTPVGLAYRIRVVCAEPNYISADNGTDISINPLPTSMFTFSLNGDTLTLTNNALDASTYVWQFGDGNSDTTNSPTHIYTAPGNYTVTLISTNSCGNDTFYTQINTVGIAQQLSGEGYIKVFPNPTKGKFTIEFISETQGSYSLKLINQLGQIVWEKELMKVHKDDLVEIILPDLPKSIYTLKVLNFEKSFSRQLMIY